jgi:UDP-N-acetylglucosamine 2-epimerase (non-hydrolysing)
VPECDDAVRFSHCGGHRDDPRTLGTAGSITAILGRNRRNRIPIPEDHVADRIVHVVGARPNFIKAAPVLRALSSRGAEQALVHTGQHYDAAMSDVFFAELGLPTPDLNLGVGSGSQAGQTAALLVALEDAFARLDPTLLVVYGDVNSTLAAALVAAKLGVPIAHVEAGLRSFDNSMPEEINRRVADLLSTLLFVTCPEGIDNLRAMGTMDDAIQFVGNPMIDTLLSNLGAIRAAGAASPHLLEGQFAVATMHRPGNVDTPERAAAIVTMLNDASEVVPIILPLHPRGRRSLEEAGLRTDDRLHVVEPLGYLEFLGLVSRAALVITDSGGIQEETTALGIPCLTVRPNTERPITISHGTNRLVEPGDVAKAAAAIVHDGAAAPPIGPPLWDGHAGERIAAVIEGWLRGSHPAGGAAPAGQAS